MPTTALASACASTVRHGDSNVRKFSAAYMPMNTAACTAVAATNIRSRGSAAVTMNCWPDGAREKPDDQLRQSADTEYAARQGVLDQPGETAREHATDRTVDQRDVDHGDKNQVHRGRRSADESIQRRLQGQRDGYSYDGSDRPHLVPFRGFASVPLVETCSRSAGGGVWTTSTASSELKSTAGRTTTFTY